MVKKKENNTYRFQGFSERVANIKVDVLHKIGRRSETPEEQDTFISEALGKWSELNCTLHYQEFSRKVRPYIQSLAQLLYHVKEVIPLVKEYLKTASSLAVEPLLDMVVQLARDLRNDFYPYFREFFDILVSLLNTQETEVLENVFKTLGFLFKFLWSQLSANIEDVFRYYCPLLGGHQKIHIQQFAAESFAFLLRKVKNHHSAFDAVLSALASKPDLWQGVGFLLAEMCKGVRRQFHSCTEKLLPVILRKLGPFQDTDERAADLPWDIVFKSLSHMVQLMAKFTTKEHGAVVENTLIAEVRRLHSIYTQKNFRHDHIQDLSCQLSHMLQLVEVWVEWNGGAAVSSPLDICNLVCDLVAKDSLPATSLSSALVLGSSLLLTNFSELSYEPHRKKIISQSLTSSYPLHEVFCFCKSLFHWQTFREEVVPPLLNLCQSELIKKLTDTEFEEIILMLTNVVLVCSESSDMSCGIDLIPRQGLLYFPKCATKQGQVILKQFVNALKVEEHKKSDGRALSVAWGALVCLPCIRPLSPGSCASEVLQLINHLGGDVSEHADVHREDLHLFVLGQAIQSYIAITFGQGVKGKHLDLNFVTQLLRKRPDNVHVLQACCKYLMSARTSNTDHTWSAGDLQELYKYLEPNLSSSAHLVRLLSLKMLASFDQITSTVTGEEPVQCSLFQRCLEAEQIPVTLDSYRNKLVCLRKLAYSPSTFEGLPEVYSEVVPRYLIGLLYINFSPFWPPLIEIIQTFTDSRYVKTFWKVFSERLVVAADSAEKALEQEASTNAVNASSQLIDSTGTGSLCDLVRSQYAIAAGPREDSRTDHVNFRLLMWKTMMSFPEVTENRSRDVVPLLLRFMSNEYFTADESVAPSQDIRSKSVSEPRDTADLVPVATEATTEDCTEEHPDLARRTKRRAATKSLCAHLALFAKFRNPKALSKEPKLRQLYMNLLTHKDGEVQKLAVNCLFTYKFQYLEPYREDFEKLLNDETFRDALTHFSVDEESGVVEPGHRENLVPILIRLLYGRMQRWTGVGSGGKAGGGARRAVVLRFLASCPVSEMKVFMDLILAPFMHLYRDDDTVTVSTTDLSRVVPLKKQQGFLNMVLLILSKLGNLVSAFLPMILSIILSLLSSCAHALDHRDQVHSGHISQLRTIRQLAITRIVDFFETLPEYNYGPVCDSIFRASVWPQLEKLSSESIQHPTPLLKLLSTWTKNARFFPLLATRLRDKPVVTILGCVYACLTAPAVATSVVAMVMEMTDNLLSLKDYEPQGVSGLLEDKTVLSIPPGVKIDHQPTYGTVLVLPHLSIILKYLSRTVKTISHSFRAAGKKRSTSILPQLELSVLSKISPYTTDPDHSAMLVQLLLPFLYSNQKEETENNMVKTVSNLLPNLQSPAMFVKPLSKLFSQLSSRFSRQSLCKTFEELAVLDPGFKDVAQILTLVNSWDSKRLEEPNYEMRLAGFSTASRLIGEKQFAIDETLPVLHNCVFYVTHTEDLSIRDSAVSCLTAIVEKVARDQHKDEFDELIMGCVVPACKSALKSNNELARNEILGILSIMVKQFNHPSLVDMRVLIDNDPEVDFFENIRHIQLHRRIRALRRLDAQCEKHTLSANTLASFMLPLVTHCLLDHTTAKEHNLVTQAVTSIGAISLCLPWSRYYGMLKHYLRKLPREKAMQKTIIRVVVAILNNFHFDMSAVSAHHLEELKNAAVKKTDTAADDKETDNKEDEEDDKVDEEGDVNEEQKHLDDNKAEEDKVEISEELATRIYDTITTKLLPQLRKCLTKKVKTDGVHRLSRNKAEDDEEILRVPVVLAMVKLLQALPKETLHLHLPGFLLRVCQALKSRARDVRDVARETLTKIAVSLGPKYFAFVLKEMRSCLSRGYQLHVLSFTLHTLLERLSETISPGDLDHCLESITEVLVEDLFGEVATEREVEKIANKLHEAKTCRSFDSCEIMARFIGPSSLVAFVAPLKQVLDGTQSHKVSRRVEEVFRRIGVGLQGNASVTPQTLLIFIHGLTSERLPLMNQKAAEKEAVSEPADPRLQPSNTFILPDKPVRGSKTPETSAKTNSHIVVEFGLQLLHLALKRGKLATTDQEHHQMLDPFVSILADCIKSQHTKVLTLALRCVCWIIKMPLPALKRFVPQMAKNLFKLLKKYARAGAKVGENYEMVLVAFKTMTGILRDFKEYTVAEKHLQILLGFVEEDIHDHTRQGAAFPLLKAILSRKLITPEINDVMVKVAQLSVTGSSPSVLLQCRQAMLQYLLDYPLGKKLEKHLDFFVSQLDYEHETGRESALEMLASMFASFPEKLLFDYAGFFFVPLSSRLVNDESANCRKLTALAIKSLVLKLDVERRDNLFAIVMLWFEDFKLPLRRLASQVCGLFVESEGKGFERRLSSVLPIIISVIEPEQYETQENQDGDEAQDESSLHRVKDHLLFNALTTLAKILSTCRLVRVTSRAYEMSTVWDSVERHLVHPHSWVRLAGCRLFGLLFASWKPQELAGETTVAALGNEYLMIDTAEKVKRLCNEFCLQLESPYLNEELGEQVVKNLVFLARTLHLMGRKTEKESLSAHACTVEDSEDEDTTTTDQDDRGLSSNNRSSRVFTLDSLLRKMGRLATHEASYTPKKILKRTCVIRWMAAVAVDLGRDHVKPYLVEILKPVHREVEIAAAYKDPVLQSLAQEVLGLIRELVGKETFSGVYASIQQGASESRQIRKKRKALEAVADPAKSARRKVKKNLAKKEQRKRKLDRLKPTRRFKKSRVDDI